MSSTSGITLLGMGNPLLDISANVPDEVLTKYDVQTNNAILAEEKHIPLYQELVDEYDVQFIAGGATQNSIRVAQWMLGTPGMTGYMGAIGMGDEFGQKLKTCATEDGVEVHYYEDETTPTGTCAVLVNGGDRSLVANLSAANKFTDAHLATPKAVEMVASARFYYIAGFFLTVSVDSIVKVATHAVEEGKVLAMNLSAPFLVQFFGDQMATALPYCDYVFGNESEAEAFGEKHGWGKDLPTIALKLAAMPKSSGTRARTVVFTQGALSTIVATNGTVSEFPVDPLSADQLVDTNGAGDAFVGGFLAQLIKGEPLDKCVQAGHWASRVIIQRSGCTFPEECNYSS
ncbi:unnamed protein product [Discosporangium mesarthrocarpum]